MGPAVVRKIMPSLSHFNLIAQSTAPLTMSELSNELNVPMSTATRIVDWLVRGDMVERANDPNDRR